MHPQYLAAPSVSLYERASCRYHGACLLWQHFNSDLNNEFDPAALEHATAQLSGLFDITFANTAFEACEGSDALLITVSADKRNNIFAHRRVVAKRSPWLECGKGLRKTS
jgi:hypothetical protein